MPRNENFFIKLSKFLIYLPLITTPLIIGKKTSETFEIPKMLNLYLISSLVLTLIISIVPKPRRILRENFFKIFILFLATQFLSFIFSIDKYLSFFGYYSRLNGGIVSLIYFFILSAGVFFFIKNKDEINKFFQISVITSTIVSIIGILTKYKIDLLCLYLAKTFNNCWIEEFKPEIRIFSTLGQPNWLAAYLNINLFFILYFLLKSKDKRKIWYLVYILNLAALVFTGSASGLLAFLFSFLLVLAGLSLKIRQGEIKTESQSLLILSLITLITISVAIDKKFIKQKIKGLTANQSIKKELTQTATKQISEIKDSGKIRLIVWKGAIELWKKYPLLGTGPETFAIAYYFTRPKEHNLTVEWNFVYNKAHNEFLNYLANTGLIGFIGFLILILYPYFVGTKTFFQKKGEILPLFLLGSLTTIHITNFFGFSTSTISFYLFTLPVLFIKLAKPENKAEKNLSLKKQKLIFIAALIIGIASLHSTLKFYFADRFFKESQEANLVQDYKTQIQKLQAAIKTLYLPHYADKLAAAVANVAFYYPKDKNYEENIKNAQQTAIYFNNLSLEDSPKNIFYMRTRVRINLIFYQLTGDKKLLDEAIKTAEKAAELAPTNPEIGYLLSFSLTNKYLNDKKMLEEKVLPTIERVIELKPNYILCHELKAKVLFLIYGKEEAISYLEKINQSLNSDQIKTEIIKLKNLNNDAKK